MSVSDIYNFSILSGAAYANDTGGGLADALNSSTLINLFAPGSGKYSILDISTTSTPNYSGFAAMVAKDKTTNQITIAFRGTEPGSLLDYAADADILTSGCSRSQIVDMYNYVARLRGAVGQAVIQYKINVDDELEVSSEYTTGLGIIKPGDVVNLTGHSLDGHLALAA